MNDDLKFFRGLFYAAILSAALWVAVGIWLI
jgi:hypothetical protein